jgi:ubiquinone/menaquinone biosynthesis C-methylase UbiE
VLVTLALHSLVVIRCDGGISDVVEMDVVNMDVVSRERAERDRIERVYKTYLSDPFYEKLWSDDVARFSLERKWQEVERVLRAEAVDLSNVRLLDLGAGTGADCERFLKLGFEPKAIVVLDLLYELIEIGKKSHRWLNALNADSGHLPFRDGSFDVVHQSTMLSSVLDPDVRSVILREVGRVLAPGGVFVSYDMRYPNPWNRNTRPVMVSTLRAAFPNCWIHAFSITPIPQILRLLGPFAIPMWRSIERLAPLRSHVLAVVRKSKAGGGKHGIVK